MFAYLKQYNKSRLVFDETKPNDADMSTFVKVDRCEYYPDIEEAIPLNEHANPVKLESTLKRKHNRVAYHRVRWLRMVPLSELEGRYIYQPYRQAYQAAVQPQTKGASWSRDVLIFCH